MDDDDRTQSERRWRQAQSVLDGVGDAAAERRLRRQVVTRRWIVVGAAAVPLVVVAVILALSRGRDHTSSDASDLPTWREILGFSMQLGGLAVEFFGLVRSRRARRGSLPDAPLLFLTRSERKALMTQVRGQVPPIPSQLPLARHLALRVTQQSSILVGVGAGLLAVGQALVNDQLWFTFFVAAAIPFLAWGIRHQRRELARARLFLARNPDPDSQEPTAGSVPT